MGICASTGFGFVAMTGTCLFDPPPHHVPPPTDQEASIAYFQQARPDASIESHDSIHVLSCVQADMRPGLACKVKIRMLDVTGHKSASRIDKAYFYRGWSGEWQATAE